MADLHARVTDQEHAAARRFADGQGVSLSGLVSALCQWLETGQETSPEVERCIKMLVESAKDIDNDRRSRKPE